MNTACAMSKAWGTCVKSSEVFIFCARWCESVEVVGADRNNWSLGMTNVNLLHSALRGKL